MELAVRFEASEEIEHEMSISSPWPATLRLSEPSPRSSELLLGRCHCGAANRRDGETNHEMAAGAGRLVAD